MTINANSKGTPTAGILDASWQLATGYYEPRTAPMEAVYPRPDAETNSYARHRKQPIGQKYVIPIGVKHGSYPLKYEIIDAPAGCTIGGTLVQVGDVLTVDSEYGLLTWLSPTAGTHNFKIRTYDQDYGRGNTSIDLDWTCDVSDTGHIWVDETATDDTGTGTFADPLKTINGWYKSLQSDATYQGYHVHYMAGTYDLDIYDAANGNLKLDDTKPLVHLPYEDDAVIFDYSLCAFTTESTTTDACADLFIGDIQHLDNTNQNPAFDNARCFSILGIHNRLTWFKSEFKNTGRGALGNANPAGVYGASVARDYLYFCRCSSTGVNEAPILDFYGASKSLVEHTDVAGYGSYSTQSIFLKSDCVDSCVRHNFNSDSGGITQMIDLLCQSQSIQMDDIEVSYNTCVSNADDTAMRLLWTTGGYLSPATHQIFRNTVVGSVEALDHVSAEATTFLMGRNIVVSDTVPPIRDSGTYITMTKTENIETTVANSPLDASHLLTGADRITYLGRRGAEIKAEMVTV